MLLKKLTANGFKSFADKIELDFGAGVTCIVGPNGCGKSNVVDAIKWVLGEQSAKSLRGTQMMDIIFSGSGTRKSAAMAQVDLTFDNSDGTLPTDQAEVVVSRRLYRSGDSEYLLNKTSCRLKDIRELFLDTGMGVGAYSVVEQGQVAKLLQANPVERRAVFEEAAGINKYKARKKEALRRLDNVNQNLQRVQDVVEEIEKRLRSVKLAAGKARSYQSYTQELRELRSRYALAEYHRLRVSDQEFEQEAGRHSDQATGIRTELSNLEARASEANVRIVDLDREIGLGDGRFLTVQSQITAHEERTAASERRIGDQTALLERSRERLAGFEEKMSALESRIAEQSATAEAIAAELSAVHEELAGHQQRDHSVASALNEANRRLEDEKHGILDLMRRTANLRNEIQAFTIQHEHLTSQKTKLDERDAALANELASAMARQHDLQGRLEAVVQLIEDQKRKIEETKARIAAVAENRAKLLDQIAAAKEYRSGLQSRRQLLEEMDRKHEGLNQGPREVLARRDADETGKTFGYVRGAVGEMFEADVAHASLVEAVLGSQQQYLVVEEREPFLVDRDLLQDLGGRLQVFCLDSIPPGIGGPAMDGQPGFIANLIDWVRYPAELEKLARLLLGRTYVVETLEYARQMVTVEPGARFVTMEGIVWEPDGRIALGPIGAGTGMISRRGELRELARNLEEVDQRIVALGGQLEESDHEASHLEDVQHDLREAAAQASNERVAVQSELSSVGDVVRRLSNERPLIAAEVTQIVRQMEMAEEKSQAGRVSLTELEQRNAERERIVAELQADIEKMNEQRRAIVEDITKARVRTGELTQQRSSVAETLRELQAARVQLQTERDKASRDVVEAQQRIEQSQQQIEAAKQTLESLRSELAELTRKLAALRQERDELRQALEQNNIDQRRLRGELEQVEAHLHECQMKLQEVRVRHEELAARIREELQVDLAEQYQSYVPQEEEDWPAVEAQIDDLRAKIERLGNVNLDAITEQEELEKRLEFLTGQLNDLRESEKQLLSLIEKLNYESVQRFMATFTAVQGHFSALFKKLFGGGKAELILQNGEDVLECGIEVTARPPGKEPQSISLLSGGEKAMTAIALLMAVYRSRPSPFVLLDEVDAPLDEANNVRFNNVIKEFSKISQFIVITHSKRTMSTADVMYGITMQEAGVSKRVSVRFEEERGKSAVA